MNSSKHPLNEEPNPPLIVIVGETGSGKSGLAMKIALDFNGEIITADSRTVYIGMDIGTAKPSKAEQRKVVHHGLDLTEPNKPFSAAQFKDYSYSKIAEIRHRNKLPIMVGGTGLYVDGVLFDYSFSTKSDSTIRSSLNNMTVDKLAKMAQKKGIELQNDMLHNKRQLIRLIERGVVEQKERELPINTLVVGIRLSRQSLRYNIERRVEKMFKVGLRREVDELVAKYGWENEALTGIGYSEFKQFYEGSESMSKIKRLIVQNSLKYAKRQRTWFKRNRHIEWFEDLEPAELRIREYLRGHGYTEVEL